MKEASRPAGEDSCQPLPRLRVSKQQSSMAVAVIYQNTARLTTQSVGNTTLKSRAESRSLRAIIRL